MSGALKSQQQRTKKNRQNCSLAVGRHHNEGAQGTGKMGGPGCGKAVPCGSGAFGLAIAIAMAFACRWFEFGPKAPTVCTAPQTISAGIK